MSYLFLFHIGPVQSFIASARRTRDLWFGSQLLSDLSWTTAAYIAEHYGHEALIFPAFMSAELHSETTERNVSNKIFALLEPKEDVTSFTRAVARTVEQRLDRIKEQLYQDLREVAFHKEVMDRQLKDCLEFFWVALPFPYQGNNDYAQIRTLLESQMAARKGTYTYRSVSWGSAHHKSSITGTLESIIPDDYYWRTTKEAMLEQERLKRLYDDFHAGPNEHLSGIDLLKRRGHFPDTSHSHAFFLSTSHIAAQPYLERLKSLQEPARLGVKNAWKTYYNYIKINLPTLRHEHIPPKPSFHPHEIIADADGALLFEEHLTEHAANNPAILQQACLLLGTFKSEVNKANQQNLEIDPYYAIIVADGDQVGKTIDHLAKGAEGYKKHQLFSRQLALFAGKAKEIVHAQQGTLIYAGGDDVLALVPLHNLLACTTQLADKFEEILAAELTDVPIPTLSIGVAIVHHLSLLQESLELARKAEHSAKAVPDKNALAILISKRGGEQSIIKGPRKEITAALEQIIEYYRGNVIPAGLAYELRTVYQHLLPIEQKLSDELKEVLWSNTKRILKRKLELPGSKVRQASSSVRQTEEEEKQQQALAKEILSTLLSRIEGRPAQERLFEFSAINPPESLIPLPEFINELLIARELAEALQLADGTQIILRPRTTEGVHA